LALKIGLGYDIHRLVKGRALFLGGVEIPHPAGLLGHSDGDALVHAVIDAVLGAMGGDDIGRLFPDTDPAYSGIRSVELLRRVMLRMKRKKMFIVHLDTVIVAQAPKIAPLAESMKAVLCPVLGIPKGSLAIKAKTNEGLGLIGREKAIACWAVALLERRPGKAAGRRRPGSRSGS
jgi:2-C-methyl-D-erythritol 2,4-cyclodiphosphate synthase